MLFLWIFVGGHSDGSSKRYKKNIQSIDYEIFKEILNVNAKSYILKCNNTKNIGIVAEDIYDNCKNLRDYILHYESVEDLTKENNNKKVELDEKYTFTKNISPSQYFASHNLLQFFFFFLQKWSCWSKYGVM